MKSSSLTTLSFLFISFLITIHSSSAQDLINSTCKAFAEDDQNIDYTFCTTSLQAAPASRCATLQGLGAIAIRMILDNVTDTQCYIKHLMGTRGPSWDNYSYVKQCLDDCFELFSDAIPSAKKALGWYKSRRFDDANIMISSVMAAATTCEDGFKERRGVVSPLTKRNGDAFQLSAIALSFMHMVQTGSGW